MAVRLRSLIFHFQGHSAAYGSQANQPMDYIAMEEDVFIENRKKNERFDVLGTLASP